MIENDEKGSYGAYSAVGKNSIDVFSNVRRKDIILNPQNYGKNKVSIIDFLKRNGYHNIHGDDQQFKHGRNEDLDESQLEEVEEEIDIFKMEATRKLNKKPTEKKNKKKIDENEPNYYHRTDKEFYKFHDLHRQKGTPVRPDTTPTCTKYLPSKNLVWRKTINWPSWDKLKGRKPFISSEENDSKFYINHGNIISQAGPCFINMDKQTMRGERVPESHNLRIITTRPFTPNNYNSQNFYHRPNKNNKKLEIDVDHQYNKGNKVLFRNNNKLKTNKNNLGRNRYKNYYGENQKINDEINSKWLKSSNRGVSAATSSTRPQTGKPLNINVFHSRPTTSSPSGTLNSNKNANTNENNINILQSNKSHITSKYISKEE